jgi:hypothetical protein
MSVGDWLGIRPIIRGMTSYDEIVACDGMTSYDEIDASDGMHVTA